ncbi:hypothetical protein MMC13_006566 [Lambiella insularis]|nr:hypothetical protein [Lambiella insularis]
MSAPGFLDSMSPWTSRSTTPKPGQVPQDKGSLNVLGGRQQGRDHRVSQRQRLSLRDYPEDCPPLNIRWFYAVDIPKRKPLSLNKPIEETKPPTLPKKFVAFSSRDSRSIESAFQRLADEEEALARRNHSTGDIADVGYVASDPVSPKRNTSINDSTGREQGGPVKVPVNEDFLFDVDIDNRELAPAYWLGPIYDVRRASWFYQEGSTLRPCDENLATQLEEGYIKAKPWRYEPSTPARRTSNSKQRPTSLKPGEDMGKLGATNIKPPRLPSADDAKNRTREESPVAPLNPPKFQLQTHRLFGMYMNSVVTYQDSTVAWLLTDDFLSRMSSSVYQRFAGGGHLGGVKVIRGYLENNKVRDGKVESEGVTEHRDSYERGRPIPDYKRRSAPLATERNMSIDVTKAEDLEVESESKRAALERRMATIVGSPGPEDPASQEEEVRKRDENEIRDDYRDADGEEQGREIEHLILVTHGIGQRLGLKMESVNFVHDVNVLRKTLKSVYENSPDLQALNSEVDKLPKNCRVQVLPVVWRHLLDFPKQSLKQNRKEQDLTDADVYGDEDDYPSLSDITVEGVPAVRNLITDLALDILLYQSAYREHIAGIVQRECNRVYGLFLQRNTNFKGKVSLIGHSLGSAIMFDVLCRQREINDAPKPAPTRSNSKRISSLKSQDDSRHLNLDFDVEDFFCLGSPLGLFQMLKGRTIAGRKGPDAMPAESPMDPDSVHDPFSADYSRHGRPNSQKTDILAISVSSPKCEQLFNIFHPTDPIAYRIEPLISPAMSALKPQPLPYTKRGIFAAPGLTNIGARVGQSVSGFWSNITTGVASSLLNRSLGLTEGGQYPPAQTRVPLSMGAGTNIAGGGVIAGPEALEEEKKKAAANAAADKGDDVEHPATLLDTEIETLYSGFQKRRKSLQSDEGRDLGESSEWQGAEDRARRLRREEAKVRALNSNGRVDFSIQEGVFDISLIASIASHLTYWADEDVSHFMISQLLSRQRVVRR